MVEETKKHVNLNEDPEEIKRIESKKREIEEIAESVGVEISDEKYKRSLFLAKKYMKEYIGTLETTLKVIKDWVEMDEKAVDSKTKELCSERLEETTRQAEYDAKQIRDFWSLKDKIERRLEAEKIEKGVDIRP
jgi:hypothetical protein